MDLSCGAQKLPTKWKAGTKRHGMFAAQIAKDPLDMLCSRACEYRRGGIRKPVAVVITQALANHGVSAPRGQCKRICESDYQSREYRARLTQETGTWIVRG